MSDDVILAYIKNSGASYNLSADDILYLNNQGVSQPVISALLQAKSSVPSSTPVATPATLAPSVSQPQVSPYPGQVSPYPGQPVESVPPSSPPPGSEVSLSYFQTQLSPYSTAHGLPFRGRVSAGCTRLCRRPCPIGALISTKGIGFTRMTAGPGNPIIPGANMCFTMAAGCGKLLTAGYGCRVINWGLPPGFAGAMRKRKAIAVGLRCLPVRALKWVSV